MKKQQTICQRVLEVKDKAIYTSCKAFEQTAIALSFNCHVTVEKKSDEPRIVKYNHLLSVIRKWTLLMVMSEVLVITMKDSYNAFFSIFLTFAQSKVQWA